MRFHVSAGLLLSTLLLSGCGGGGSGSAAAVFPTGTVQQPNLTVPQTLSQAVPPAPPSVIPASPTAAQRAQVPAALPSIVSTSAAAVRRPLGAATSSPPPVVQFSTNLGNITVELAPGVAPKNVANFLSYVRAGSYANSIIHRSVPGFIIQGGGYAVSGSQIVAIPTQPAVVNEFSSSNLRGTLAMAKLSSDPNSATSQWFFNTANNASPLDTEDGGFTVIGNIVDSQGLAVMDAIGALPIPSPPPAAPFDQIPVINYSGSGTIQTSNLAVVSNITQIASHFPFFNGEQMIGNSVYFLTLPNGNTFGYYSYLSDPRYIYHFDLGFEYTFDAGDGAGGIYFYDFQSGHFFYTSPLFPFPYLYDFTLNSVIYYYANPGNAGHYSSGPRYFYNFSTHQIITE